MRAVLFDLDGTLLDIDINAFLGTYFEALGPVVVDVIGGDIDAGLAAVMTATQAMFVRHPNQTNAERFAEAFAETTGVELGPEDWARFDTFYADVFPQLKGDIGPHDGARAAVEAARASGCQVAVATNPIFPLAAIRERIAWAGLSDIDFDLVTSYETSHATKPHRAYYLEVAEKLGVPPTDCLMIGDDVGLDMPASDVGMRTFYVGHGVATSSDFAGSLLDLPELLPRLCECAP